VTPLKSDSPVTYQLSVIQLSAVQLNVIQLSAVQLNDIQLSAVQLSDVQPSAISSNILFNDTLTLANRGN
jgi:hypothetical protein